MSGDKGGGDDVGSDPPSSRLVPPSIGGSFFLSVLTSSVIFTLCPSALKMGNTARI